MGWGSRGIAWWNGKIYTGTQDGRLIAIDAKSGTPVWSVQTFEKNAAAYITGAPRVFDGKVIIGYAGETGKFRGYVTTYDAETGKLLWRFYTVPGDPAQGFENQAMRMAAKTWEGPWWKSGGGGAVWNAFAYDAQTRTIFFGTGEGYPKNRRARSQDKGDNLFTSSIVALDGKTGAYKWHYQLNPGDTWDYDATMDIELADLTIGGKPRKVLMQAPKNGFFYVIDRVTGQLIGADPYVKVTWASRIDLKTGRPIETPGARYPNGTTADIWPSGGIGGHSTMPMAYSPQTRLVYIPAVDLRYRYSDRGIDLRKWQPPNDRTIDDAFNIDVSDPDILHGTGELLAWDPVTQKAAWKVPYPTMVNGGVVATAGDLVFQGTLDGQFRAYSASSGQVLWSFAAQAPILAAPISYSVNGKQYVTVLTGVNGPMMIIPPQTTGIEGTDPRSQARRVLTFSLGGSSSLPEAQPVRLEAIADPQFKPDDKSAKAGEAAYFDHCVLCHGVSLIAGGQAPDLRRSGTPLSADVFASVVRGGVYVPQGMPAFSELTDQQLSDLRQYIRTEAERLRKEHTQDH